MLVCACTGRRLLACAQHDQNQSNSARQVSRVKSAPDTTILDERCEALFINKPEQLFSLLVQVNAGKEGGTEGHEEQRGRQLVVSQVI